MALTGRAIARRPRNWPPIYNIIGFSLCSPNAIPKASLLPLLVIIDLLLHAYDVVLPKLSPPVPPSSDVHQQFPVAEINLHIQYQSFHSVLLTN